MITEDRKRILRQLVRGHEDGKLRRAFCVTVSANVGWVLIDWKGDDRPRLELIDLQILVEEGFLSWQVTGRNRRGWISTVQCTLRERAFQAVRNDFSPPESTTSTRYNIGAIILTALPVEYQAVRAHLTDLREEVHPQGTVYERGKFSSGDRSWEIGIVEIGPGNPGAAMEAERAINHFDPSVALFVGVAGGLKDVALGDVVAATKVYGYESGKAEATFQTRPDVINSTYRMIQRAKAEARKEDWLRRLEGSVPDPKPNVFVGPIAAGEKVVASTRSAVWKFLRSSYNDALAVEMEGHGFLKAIHANPQVDALIVRGISDLIEGKSEADAAGYQEIAARHASAFAFEILAKLEGVESKTYATTPASIEDAGGRLIGSNLARPDRVQAARELGQCNEEPYKGRSCYHLLEGLEHEQGPSGDGVVMEAIIEAISKVCDHGAIPPLRKLREKMDLVKEEDRDYWHDRICKAVDYALEKLVRLIPESPAFAQLTKEQPETLPMAQIFLCYAEEDEERVENLYQQLSDAGFRPWMAKRDILPGEIWELSIYRAIQRSDFFLACLSANSVDKRGFLQKEIKRALDVWQEKLEEDIYLIPVRLEDCEVPENLRKFHWVSLFEEDGWTRLVKAIQVGMEHRMETPIESIAKTVETEPVQTSVTLATATPALQKTYTLTPSRKPPATQRSVARIGDTIPEVGLAKEDLSMTLIGWAESDIAVKGPYKGNELYTFTARPGMKFIILGFEFHNNWVREQKTPCFSEGEVRTDKGYFYQVWSPPGGIHSKEYAPRPSTQEEVENLGGSGAFEDLLPEKSVRGHVVFEIPKDEEPEEVELSQVPVPIKLD